MNTKTLRLYCGRTVLPTVAVGFHSHATPARIVIRERISSGSRQYNHVHTGSRDGGARHGREGTRERKRKCVGRFFLELVRCFGFLLLAHAHSFSPGCCLLGSSRLVHSDATHNCTDDKDCSHHPTGNRSDVVLGLITPGVWGDGLNNRRCVHNRGSVHLRSVCNRCSKRAFTTVIGNDCFYVCCRRHRCCALQDDLVINSRSHVFVNGGRGDDDGAGINANGVRNDSREGSFIHRILVLVQHPLRISHRVIHRLIHRLLVDAKG